MKSAEKESGRLTAIFSKVIARPERLHTDPSMQIKTQIKKPPCEREFAWRLGCYYKVIISRKDEKMEFTVDYARELVEVSKVDTIYARIADRARQGWTTLKVAYITEIAFKSLMRNGFIKFNESETEEIEEWDGERMIDEDYFVISWEVI